MNRTRIGLVLLALVVTATALLAQGYSGYGRRREPLREGLPEQRGGFVFCRLLYTSMRREAGGYGWSTDYPMSDHNFVTRLGELTSTPVSEWNDFQPGYAVVRPLDSNLFQCPFLFASDVGTLQFQPGEAARIREYLLKGGFLWVDDFWGDYAWQHWLSQIKLVLPDYPVVDLPRQHKLFSILYVVHDVPQISHIQFWRRSGGATSERGAESAEPHMRAIFDERGRILVLMSHNTDIADGWEREGEDEDYFRAFSPSAYAVGINVALWAMSH